MLFIDTMTGTWGRLQDLVAVEDTHAEMLDEMSDSEICDFGKTAGWNVRI